MRLRLIRPLALFTLILGLALVVPVAQAEEDSVRLQVGLSSGIAEGGGSDTVSMPICGYWGIQSACLTPTLYFGDLEGYSLAISGRYNEADYLWGVSGGLSYSGYEDDEAVLDFEEFNVGIAAYLNLVGLTVGQPEAMRHIRIGPSLSFTYGSGEVDNDLIALDYDGTIIAPGILFEYELPMESGGLATFTLLPSYNIADLELEEIDLDTEDYFTLDFGIAYRF